MNLRLLIVCSIVAHVSVHAIKWDALSHFDELVHEPLESFEQMHGVRLARKPEKEYRVFYAADQSRQQYEAGIRTRQCALQHTHEDGQHSKAELVFVAAAGERDGELKPDAAPMLMPQAVEKTVAMRLMAEMVEWFDRYRDNNDIACKQQGVSLSSLKKRDDNIEACIQFQDPMSVNYSEPVYTQLGLVKVREKRITEYSALYAVQKSGQFTEEHAIVINFADSRKKTEPDATLSSAGWSIIKAVVVTTATVVVLRTLKYLTMHKAKS